MRRTALAPHQRSITWTQQGFHGSFTLWGASAGQLSSITGPPINPQPGYPTDEGVIGNWNSLEDLRTMPSLPESYKICTTGSEFGESQQHVSASYGDLFSASSTDTPLILPPMATDTPQMPYLNTNTPFYDTFNDPFNQNSSNETACNSRAVGPVMTPNPRAGLPRRRSRYFFSRSRETVTPISIPFQPSSDLDPMQRWQESPPEDEPASMSAIMNAVNTSEQKTSTLQTYGAFRHHRRPASLASSNSGTSISSWQSATSTRSTASAVSQDPLAAQNQGHSRVGKKRRQKPAVKSSTEKDRQFCCTFCCDKFKTKYDWIRHEKALHLNLETWVCTPFGGAPASPLSGRRHCAYCHCLDPSPEHLEEHNYHRCSNGARTFQRKDHLVQHLRLVHRLQNMPMIDEWKTASQSVTSRCGFCNCRLASWEERIEHLAAHFRKGSTMKSWQGDHEFEPAIAAQVKRALPPYYIASESVSMVPFSATNFNTVDHFAQISSRAHWANDGIENCENQQIMPDETNAADDVDLVHSLEQLQTRDIPLKSFMEVLILHLSRYARQQMSLGVLPTDEMFQREARQVLYDSEDTWNQTIVDNPEWIASFRKQLCGQLDASTSAQDNSLSYLVTRS
ncbi:hypothetical protein N7462_003623 [Penicillium macrosclerotiorum]|uniref:uncharacterized protein n=1 Tax=Penicillium macrosclerotiorum TaxID=303699 RepID=UPI002548BDE0|nr:uncharacterized protein N7462_003623 [Penicillium macrosclerotiorum]KAJ5689231.1 hypothetical protein N7462_003623 [Penicillium macrosclerotiorum]